MGRILSLSTVDFARFIHKTMTDVTLAMAERDDDVSRSRAAARSPTEQGRPGARCRITIERVAPERAFRHLVGDLLPFVVGDAQSVPGAPSLLEMVSIESGSAVESGLGQGIW